MTDQGTQENVETLELFEQCGGVNHGLHFIKSGDHEVSSVCPGAQSLQVTMKQLEDKEIRDAVLKDAWSHMDEIGYTVSWVNDGPVGTSILG